MSRHPALFRRKIHLSPVISPPPPPPHFNRNFAFGRLQRTCLTRLPPNIVNLLLLQPDPTKVESVQDVLARAAAKGLLGEIIPEQSRKGKKQKGRKDPEDPPDSKPSSPSSHDGETGNEFEDGREPLYGAGHEEKRGEDEPEKGKGGKKRGAKGRKVKVKRRAKQSASVSRKQLKDNRKAAKKKQQSPPRRQARKRRARKIPRLTLTLMSSAKPSGCWSTITALAHKLSQSGAAESQQMPDSSPRLPAPRPDASPRLPASLPAAIRKPNPNAGRAEKTLKSIKAGPSKTRAKAASLEAELKTQVGSEVTDWFLPPISRPSPSRSGSSASHQHSRASRSKTSASSSTSLLGL